MSDQELLERARNCAREGAYREAAGLFEAYLADGRDDSPQVSLELGYALLLAGDLAGARRIHKGLAAVFDRMTGLPARLLELWERFVALVAGTPRRVVLTTGVTAALMAGCGCSGDAPTARPVSARPPTAAATRPVGTGVAGGPAPAVAPLAPLGAGTPAAGVPGGTGTPLDGLSPLGPLAPAYSAHRYSGGVRLPVKDLVDSEEPEERLDTDLPNESPGRPSFSAHRYSGGVALDLDLEPSAPGAKTTGVTEP